MGSIRSAGEGNVRTITIVGHDDFARDVAGEEYPHGIHLEVEVEQVRNAG